MVLGSRTPDIELSRCRNRAIVCFVIKSVFNIIIYDIGDNRHYNGGKIHDYLSVVTNRRLVDYVESISFSCIQISKK
jgi:hypothetical protein